MTTEKRIEIAARFLGNLAGANMTAEDIKARCRDALAIADILEQTAHEELMNAKIDWAKAPADATIAVKTPYGRVDYASYKSAVAGQSGWEGIGDGEWLTQPIDDVAIHGWRESLERRPE